VYFNAKFASWPTGFFRDIYTNCVHYIQKNYMKEMLRLYGWEMAELNHAILF